MRNNMRLSLLVVAHLGLASPVLGAEDSAEQFDLALSALQAVIQSPDECLTAERKCEKITAALERQMLRALEADSLSKAMKLVAGVVKKSARVKEAVFGAGWLDRVSEATRSLVLAAAGIVDTDMEALEQQLDAYGSDLGRFARRISAQKRKREKAEMRRSDDSLGSSATYLRSISGVHAAADKLVASIDAFIEATGLVIIPPSDFNVVLYENALATAEDLKGWVMEGPGQLEFRDSWMEMRDPKKKGHHVLWCPVDFPATFAAEWELQNLHPQAGLLISFFAATGRNGEDVLDPSLRRRTGDFDGYIKGDIDNYHISYYANTPSKPDRAHSRLRKNRGFKLLQSGEKGVPAKSEEIYTIRLVKDGLRIKMFVDGRKIIDYTDRDDPHQGGKIGFRQMQWSHFRYRNFRVYGTE